MSGAGAGGGFCADSAITVAAAIRLRVIKVAPYEKTIAVKAPELFGAIIGPLTD
jgi:hypothetical protein